MKTFFFTEDAYPFLPPEETYESIRVDLPNSHYDPVKGADLYHQYIDMWQMAEDLGLNMMLNEHHQTPTCVVPSVPIMAGILARQTKKARILVLGSPLSNRAQPVRVAEEMAMIDVISRGRLECGFVRSVPTEAAPSNVMPYRGTERLWEAHDLILKAWTTHDGPFNFEGRWFHYRQVNIWPRPYQQPHPPVWVTIGSAATAVPVAKRDYTGAVFLAGYPRVRTVFDGYREGYRAAHGTEAPPERLAYAALVYVGENEEEARAGAEKILWYMTSNKVPARFRNPPGYHPNAISAQVISGALTASVPPREAKLDDQMARGNVFAGTPDQVFEQIKAFWEYSGGFGNLLMMGQAGFLTFEETEKSLTLFAREVAPRLEELSAGWNHDSAQELREGLPDKQLADLGDFGIEFVR